MLELVHCSGQDGAQDPEFFQMKSRLQIILWIIVIHCMNHLIGWMQPYLSLLIDPFLLDGYVHTTDLCLHTLLWMVAPIPQVMY